MTEENKYPSQLAERFQIRMPDGLRDRLRAAAEANGRSMNTEIISRLQDTFDQDDKNATWLAKQKWAPQNEMAAIRRELSLIRAAMGPVVETRLMPDGSEEITFRRQHLEPLTEEVAEFDHDPLPD